jgi:antitoxin HigA-1
MPMKEPPHPGRSIRTACLEPLGLSVTEGAEVLGVTRQTLNNVVNGNSGISPQMAIRLAKAFGSTPETWLRMQLAYDLAAARKDEDKIKVRRQHIPQELERLLQHRLPAGCPFVCFSGTGWKPVLQEAPSFPCPSMFISGELATGMMRRLRPPARRQRRRGCRYRRCRSREEGSCSGSSSPTSRTGPETSWPRSLGPSLSPLEWA